MNENFFNDFVTNVPGVRIASDVPTLKVQSTFNRFQLNAAAVDLMGLKAEDKVLIITHPDETIDDVNKIYFIHKHSTKGSNLSESGSALEFSYSGVYPAMQIGDPSVRKAGAESMKKADCFKDAEKKTANKTVTYTVEPAMIGEGEDAIQGKRTYNGEENLVFALVEREEADVKGSSTED